MLKILNGECMKHLSNELYYRRFSADRERWFRKHKNELPEYVAMLAEFHQTGNQSLKPKIEELKIRIIRSGSGYGDEISVSIDVLNSIERDFLLKEILEPNKKNRSFFSKKIDAVLAKV